MDKLTRINNLDEDMRKNRSEKTKVTEQIEELKSKSQDLDAHYLEMQNSKRMLGKEQYKDKKLRKKIVNYSKNSDFPETAIKLKPYINVKDWDEKEIPDDILDAFVKIETVLRNESLNKTGIKDLIDRIGTFFIQDDEDGGFSKGPLFCSLHMTLELSTRWQMKWQLCIVVRLWKCVKQELSLQKRQPVHIHIRKDL